MTASAAAIETRALVRLADEAHSLKGASLTLGLEDMGDACVRLEDASRKGDFGTAATEFELLYRAWQRVHDRFRIYFSVQQ